MLTNTLLAPYLGVGLAAMVASKKGLKQVYVQEVDNIVPHTRSNLQRNNCLDITVISAFWGNDLLNECEKLDILSTFDMIIMADVLYHEEHMPELMESILRSMSPSCKIVICYEQRRKDLNKLFFDDLLARLSTYSTESCQYSVTKWMVYRYAIEQDNEDLSTANDTDAKRTVQFYMHIIDVSSTAPGRARVSE